MPRGRSRQKRGRERARSQQQSRAEAREALERRWYSRIEFAPEYSALATRSDLDEPLHRWLPYREGFHPELIRRVIADGDLRDGPILDPFSGSGVTVLEAARQGRSGLGVEPVGALAFLTAVRLRPGEVGADAAEAPAGETPEEAWASARNDVQRATVLMAVARQYKGDGRPRKDAPAWPHLLAECADLIRRDAETALPGAGLVLRGDARRLPLREATAGGIVTSPPYYTRYDYERQNRPLESLYREAAPHMDRPRQLSAHRGARARPWRNEPHEAVAEACSLLREEKRTREAGTLRSYGEDLAEAVGECARVLKSGAPLVMVIAGARPRGVYAPLDLVCAEVCERAGLQVEEILRLRTFGPGKRLGLLEGLAPREVILSARSP